MPKKINAFLLGNHFVVLKSVDVVFVSLFTGPILFSIRTAFSLTPFRVGAATSFRVVP
jgi:hypothetical protein